MVRLASLLTTRRLTFWAIPIFLLSASVYVHTMMVPGPIDRVGRFKGADYIQFYVMGSFARDGRLDALYQPDAHLAEGRRRIDPNLQLYAAHPNYGPQVALAFAPLAGMPFAASLSVFLAVMTLCYALSVWLLWRECDALRDHGRLVALLAAGSPLFWNVARYGQASAIPLLLFTLAFVALRRQRGFAAGLAIGCLAFKPQLGVVLGVVLLYPCRRVARVGQDGQDGQDGQVGQVETSMRRRLIAGATVAVVGQLVVAWVAAGSPVIAQYFTALWRLALDPSVIEVYPSEIHSLRGLLQLLIPASGVVSVVAAAGTIGALVVAIRCWTPGPVNRLRQGYGESRRSSRTIERAEAEAGHDVLGLRWGLLVLLTVIASPHLVSYDLLLLTVPLMLFADWVAGSRDRDASGAAVAVMLPLLYFAPFSGMIVARLTNVQISVVVMIALAWRVAVLCRRFDSGRTEARDGGAEAGSRVVPEFQHARVAVEY